MSDKGAVHKGARSNEDGSGTTTSKQVDLKFKTVSPIGANKHGGDVVNTGFYEISTANVVGAGSDGTLINLVAHGAKRGDLIRILTTSNAIEQEFMFIKKIVTANQFELEGSVTLADDTLTTFTAGDTFDIGRGVMPKYLSTGEISASISNSPIQIDRGPGGVYTAQTITKDTTVAADTIPLPVEIVGVAGTEINITAGDIGVQLFHNTANPDSVRIGDGTNEMAINVSLEAQVRDDDAIVELTAIGAQLPATLGQKARAASLATTLSTEDIVVIGLIAREATLATLNAKFGSIGQQARAASAATTLSTEDMAAIALIARETTLAALSAKFNSLGQKARANSAPFTLSTEDVAAIALISTALSDVSTETTLALMSAKLPATLGQKARADSLAATLSSEDMVVIGLIATEATLAAQSAKLPATIGQKGKAASLAVTLATDEDPLTVDEGDVVDFSNISASITTSGYTELTASTGAAATKIQIMQKGGDPLFLAIGAAASEVNKMLIMPGGSPDTIVPVVIPSGSRVSLKKATGSTATVDVFINYIG